MTQKNRTIASQIWGWSAQGQRFFWGSSWVECSSQCFFGDSLAVLGLSRRGRWFSVGAGERARLLFDGITIKLDSTFLVYVVSVCRERMSQNAPCMYPTGGVKFGNDPKKNRTIVSQIWGWSAQASGFQELLGYSWSVPQILIGHDYTDKHLSPLRKNNVFFYLEIAQNFIL